MMIRVQAEDFDPGAELARFCQTTTDVGAVATFLGLVRGDGGLIAMTLDHYPGMTERQLEAIEAEARRRWPLADALVIHRHGRLLPGDNIVFVATASTHRQAAFEACEFLMDWLKTKAPFWKFEEHAQGGAWVEAKSTDDAAAARWE
ncbi:MAG: molybdenum cofactor biosynthesis protein MoaE [Alphaproteobacteria bacterium]|nr:molybdenum cofactor biosynthesis protein MoaE [Alphaproteobacteria bacterium]